MVSQDGRAALHVGFLGLKPEAAATITIAWPNEVMRDPYRRTHVRCAKAMWLFAVCAVLVLVVVPTVPSPGDERGVFFAYVMMLLTFPLGAALYTFADGISRALALPGPAVWSRGFLAALWSLLVIVGYLQWFVVLPRLRRTLSKGT
jgi:hypothetical protein